jgi:hypothetical protein
MKRKRFRFLVHKPDYAPEVAAEIQAILQRIAAPISSLTRLAGAD